MLSKKLTIALSLATSLFTVSSYAMYADGVKKQLGVNLENSQELQLSAEQSVEIKKITASYASKIQAKQKQVAAVRAGIEEAYKKSSAISKQDISKYAKKMGKLYSDIFRLNMQERDGIQRQLSDKQKQSLTKSIQKAVSAHPEDFSEM